MVIFEQQFVANLLQFVVERPGLEHLAVLVTNMTWPLVIIWFIVGASRSRFWGIITGLVLFDTALVVWLTKFVVGRERPMVDALVTTVDQFAFPSGHAAMVTALAVTTYFLDRRVGAVGILLACLIGVSRIAVGVHYPGDVVAGWVIGFLVALVWWRFSVRITKRHLSIAKKP